MNEVTWNRPKVAWVLGVVLGGALALLLALGGFVTVEAGHRGVKTRFGRVIPGVLGEGLHFKWPFADHVTEMEVREQKLEVKTDASSRDLQEVKATIAVNFHPETEQSDLLFQEIGLQYVDRILRPAVEEQVKAVTAKFTAEQLIAERMSVRNDMERQLADRLKSSHVNITKFNIVNFEFSRKFNEAIEAKQTAEQHALQASNELKRIKVEADQKIEQARGEAEAVKLRAEAEAKSIELRATAEAAAQEKLAKVVNEQVLRLRAIEKWDGVLPRVTGSAIPFIGIEAEDRAGSPARGR